MSKLNVGQLIDLLSGFPADLPVAVDGYEGGATEHVGVQRRMVRANAYPTEWYFGEHDTSPIGDEATLDCVVISRLDRPEARRRP